MLATVRRAVLVSAIFFVLLGLATLNAIGLSGAVLQMFSHGIVASLLFAVVRTDRDGRVLDEAVSAHLRSLQAAHLTDVPSSDQHTVKPWFQGKIPFTFSLPELQNTEFQLIGGRMAYLNQTPGAQLVYQYRKHYLSVFIFPQQAVGRRFAASAGAGDQNFYHEAWTQGGLSFLVLSDSGQAQVHALAELMRTATAQS